MATLAVLENYILTSDERLLPHARQAIRFLVEAQNRTDGGWRYVPGETGDMSVFGWSSWLFIPQKSGHQSPRSDDGRLSTILGGSQSRPA